MNFLIFLACQRNSQFSCSVSEKKSSIFLIIILKKQFHIILLLSRAFASPIFCFFSLPHFFFYLAQLKIYSFVVDTRFLSNILISLSCEIFHYTIFFLFFLLLLFHSLKRYVYLHINIYYGSSGEWTVLENFSIKWSFWYLSKFNEKFVWK